MLNTTSVGPVLVLDSTAHPVCPASAPCCSVTSLLFIFLVPLLPTLCLVGYFLTDQRLSLKKKKEKKNQSIKYSSSFQGGMSFSHLMLIKQ